MGVEIIAGDLLLHMQRIDMWDRLDYLRHDPEKLAKAIMEAVKNRQNENCMHFAGRTEPKN